MSLAVWKNLSIDAVDPGRLGRFWADVLDLHLQVLRSGHILLAGRTPQHTIWINAVPEPVTVKQRVHLDVHAATTADVLALGASPLDLESFGWDVVRDPEGGELCVFEREEVPRDRLYELGIDSVDARAAARWWAEAFGATYGEHDEQPWAWVEDIPGAPLECLVFCDVPEPKTVKNRIHWDVIGDADALVAAGASQVAARPDWTVLTDPEGNEFCVFAP